MNITESIIINASLNKVFGAFYNFDHWKKALSDIVEIKINYDDGVHQYFSMTVSRPSGNETVNGFRFCDPEKYITLCHTTPPPVFHHMSGSWNFDFNSGATKVIASRNFSLKNISGSDHDQGQEASSRLRNYLKNNLAAFKKYIEKNEKYFC